MVFTASDAVRATLMLLALVMTSAGPVAANAGGMEAYGRLPLRFEANQGQTDPSVRFLARGLGYGLYLTDDETVLALARHDREISRTQRPHKSAEPGSARTESTALRIRLLGAASLPRVSGLEQLPGMTNYISGNDPARWRTDVPAYAKVRYHDVYPGIDLVYYGHGGELEYDFIVAPGADPRRIVFEVKGADRVTIDARGDLVLRTAGSVVYQRKPVIYQQQGEHRRKIDGRFVRRGHNRIGFALARYDRRRALVIDPVLSYSTYLGGSGSDSGNAIAVDSSGNAYVTGTTTSLDFPITAGAFQSVSRGGSESFPSDVFVAKLNASGSALVYATYLGGSSTLLGPNGEDFGRGIAVDAGGNAYVTGSTSSTNFPTSGGALQTDCTDSAFVVKLNPTGSGLVYALCLRGGSGFGIATDAFGNAYATGFANSRFPTTAGALRTTCGMAVEGINTTDVYVTKINPTGSALVYSTCFGGSSDDLGHAVAVDAAGSAFVTGYTFSTDFITTAGSFQPTVTGINTFAFVSKLNADGTTLVYSSYLSGGFDIGNGVAVDAAGNAYVTGWTASDTFPTTPGAFQRTFASLGRFIGDAFVSKLNATGSSLIYSTLLGGAADDVGNGIAIDASGNAYVAGSTRSIDFPIIAGAVQALFAGGGSDAFITKLNAAGGSLVYSTYLGGNDLDLGAAIAIDQSGNSYVTGSTSSTDFATTTGAFQPAFNSAADPFSSDAFVAKIAASTGFAAGATPIASDANALPTIVTSLAVTCPAAGTLLLTGSGESTALSNHAGTAFIGLAYSISRDSTATDNTNVVQSSALAVFNGDANRDFLNVQRLDSCTVGVTYTYRLTGYRTSPQTNATSFIWNGRLTASAPLSLPGTGFAGGTTSITSALNATPTIVSTLPVTCPAGGVVMVSGSGESAALSNSAGTAFIGLAYSISRDSFATDNTNVVQSSALAVFNGDVNRDFLNVQRVDGCTPGLTSTYRLTAYATTAKTSPNSFVWNGRLTASVPISLPTAGFAGGTTAIASSSNAAPTIVATLAVTCPATGSVMVSGSGESTALSNLGGTLFIGLAYSIARDAIATDNTNVVQSSALAVFNGDANRDFLNVQRVDSCTPATTATYRLTAYRTSPQTSPGSFLWNGRLTAIALP